MRVLLLLLVALSIAPLYAQDLITEDKSSAVKLLVDSDPTDAEVYIDGQLYGRTPLAVREISSGTYEVKIKKESFNTVTQKVEISALGYKEVFGVLSGKYAILNLESSVSGAEVFMGDSLLGTAPLLKVHVPLGRHTITVKSKDYFDWSLEMNAVPTQYNYKAVMKYMYGYLSLSKAPQGSEVFIDDKKVEISQLSNYKLEVGNHKVEVNHPSFNSPVEEDFLIIGETRSSIKVENDYFSKAALLKSTFVPGLGQYQDNSKIKGIAIFSGALLTGLLWLNSELSFKDKLKQYDDAKTEYSRPGYYTKLVEAHNKVLSTYDAAKKSNSTKKITMGAFIAVYAYNLIDALIFHSSGRSLTVTQETAFDNSFNIGMSLGL
ncbi:MAG TPA: PEGA domain-containing protein [Ignavibacteriales bacterium]|nr:PEGA domain-containing protein [Ignavibacteriales bacterium]